MDKRQWIEFGKIMDRIENEYNNTVSIISDGNGKYAAVSPIFVDVTDATDETKMVRVKVTTSNCEWFDSQYEALKYHFFYEYLDMDTEDIEIDIPPHLYTIADDRGITIDELVAEILQLELAGQEVVACPINPFQSCTREKVSRCDVI